MAVETSKSAGNIKNAPAQNTDRNKVPKSRRMPKAELPLAVELSYSLPVIVILMVDFAVIGFSYSAGADWVTILSRAMVATVAVGGLLAIITYVISATALAETQERLEKEKAVKEKKEKAEKEEKEAAESALKEIKA
jgi:hypothetical protein